MSLCFLNEEIKLRIALALVSYSRSNIEPLDNRFISPGFSPIFAARWWRVPCIEGARRKMGAGILAERRGHFSSATP